MRLLERLDFLKLDPRLIVDVGAGVGSGVRLLAGRFPGASVVAVDSSPGMLAEARRRDPDVACVIADAERLPFGDASVDLVFASLVLPWCRPDRFAAEAARVLSRDGLLLLASTGPDTLVELRRAWREVDAGMHVHAFMDMHDLGDLLGHAGLTEPVLDVDRLSVTYATLKDLTADLSACAARNAAAGRPPGLTSRRRWQRFGAALDTRTRDGRIAVSVELIFAQAWGRGAGPRPVPGSGEFAVPVDRIGRR
jgi:malonyl-CoA O-methyltransferase